MASLAETIRLIATKQTLNESPGAMPFMQANQPSTVGAGGNPPPTNIGPAGGTPEEPDLAGQQVVQAELILIADRAEKIAALVGQTGAADPMLQTQITAIASDISQLYADLMLSNTPDPNADPNTPVSQTGGSSQVNTNPKVAEDVVTVEDVDTIASLLEISTDLARRYVNRSFTDLGDPEISDRQAMNRKAGIKLAVDKAGGADKMWKNKSALGKKYGIPADEVRVKTTEEAEELGNSAVQAAFDSLKKGKPAAKPDTKMPGVRMPSDKIKEASEDKLQSRETMLNNLSKNSIKDNDEDDANEHIIMQLHKSITLGGKKIVKFASGQKVKVDPKDAHKAIKKFNTLKPAEKAKAQEFLRQSHNNLKQFVAEDFVVNEEEELVERVIKAEPHFIDRLESSMKTSSGKEIEFENGQKVNVPPNIAKKIVEKFRGLSAYDKQQLNKYVRSSYANLIRASRG